MVLSTDTLERPKYIVLYFTTRGIYSPRATTISSPQGETNKPMIAQTKIAVHDVNHHHKRTYMLHAVQRARTSPTSSLWEVLTRGSQQLTHNYLMRRAESPTETRGHELRLRENKLSNRNHRTSKHEHIYTKTPCPAYHTPSTAIDFQTITWDP